MNLQMRLTPMVMEIILWLHIHVDDLGEDGDTHELMVKWLTTKHEDLAEGKATPLYLINTGKAIQVHEYLDAATDPEKNT